MLRLHAPLCEILQFSFEDNFVGIEVTSVAGPLVPTIDKPGTCICTGACAPIIGFLAPTLARWTINFLSPSCIPFNPAIAWSVIETSTYSQNAYPLDKPVAESFTRLNALNCPKLINSSFTCIIYKNVNSPRSRNTILESTK